jgi:uncharacterized membrane protein YkoI
MIRTTTVAAATALALVLGVPAAFAQSAVAPLTQAQNAAVNERPTPATIKMFENVNTSLPNAIGTAESNTNGQNSNSRAFAAAFVNDNGAPIYLVDTLSNDSIYQLQIDANTGKPIGDAKIIRESQLPEPEGRCWQRCQMPKPAYPMQLGTRRENSVERRSTPQ